jgi:hypothetical protein
MVASRHAIGALSDNPSPSDVDHVQFELADHFQFSHASNQFEQGFS